MAGQAKIGIIMGSLSDWPTMKCAADVLDELGVAYEAKVVSAHRTPKRLYEYAETAKARGLKVIIAGAGGAAPLPGAPPPPTPLPRLGVPMAASDIAAALTAFAGSVDAVTFEFENVAVETARHLAHLVRMRPSAKALEVAQDRLAEKEFIAGLGIPVAPFRAINGPAELTA